MEDQYKMLEPTEGACSMEFSTTQSPVYGGGTLVVAFPEDTGIAEGAEIYLIYQGSAQRHTSSTTFIREANTIQANIPGHQTEEEVDLSVYVHSTDRHYILGSTKFRFNLDSAHHITQFLVDSVESPNSLDDLELIQSDKFDLSNEVASTLDDRLTASFESYDIPDTWNLYGSSVEDQENPEPRETVLHFAARLGLTKLASFLLDRPGGDTAVQMPNRRGELPKDIARDFGMDGLAELLSEYNRHSVMTGLQTGSTKVRTKTAVIRRFRDGTDSITTEIKDNNNCTIEEDIAMLKDFTQDADTEVVLDNEEMGRTKGHQSVTWLDQVILPGTEVYCDEVDDTEEDIEDENEPHKEEGKVLEENDESLQEGDAVGKERDCSLEIGENDDRGDNVDGSGGSDEKDDDYTGVHSEDEADLFPDDHHHHGDEEDEDATDSPCSPEPTSPVARSPSISTIKPEERKQLVEAQVQKLQNISEDIQRLRLSAEEVERRERLARFSTSCPTLDRSSPPLVEDSKAEFFKSMMHIPVPEDCENEEDEIEEEGDLDDDDDVSDSLDTDYTPEPDYTPEMNFTERRSHKRKIAIQINDVTLDSSSDTGRGSDGAEVVSNLKMGLRKRERDDLFDDIRRRSWHTNSTPGSGSSHMTGRLAVTGKCFSLSSLDSTEELVEDVRTGSEMDVSLVGAAVDSRRSPNSSLNSEPSAQSTPVEQCSPNHRPGTAASIRSANDIALDLDTSADNEAHEDKIAAHMSFSESSPSLAAVNMRGVNSDMAKSTSTPHISNFQANKENDPHGKLSQPSAQVVRRSLQHAIQEEQHTSQHARRTQEAGPSFRDAVHSRPRMSVIEFLNDPSNFENDDDRPKHSSKEDKRRRSMFAKFGSYRQKKKDKEHSKLRSNHSYVSVSFSNSRLCDACGKSMANKHALQCENCSVSVHDSSCKDQVAACTKFKSQRMIQRPQSSSVKEKVHSLPQSLMARDKGQSLPAPKVSQSLSPVSPGGSTSIASSSVLPSRVIEEAEETEVNRSDAHSNITDTYSVSTESLDDGGGSPAVDFEDDPDLAVKGPEPEAWSVTVDKKTIKHLKLSSKDVKRQDHIWELIQTEKHYNRVLKVMQKIFAFGMRHEVNMTQEHVDRIFPGLNELIEVHQAFQGRLRERQEARTDKYIENISDVLIAQYGGDVGERMKRAYGDFVSHHKEALAYYKDLLKQDKKFQMFIKKCSTNLLCKRMSVDECMLYVTQRLSKYPPLIEAVIKPMKDASRDMKAEKDGLRQAVQQAQDILKHVDEQVHARDCELRLIEIYNRLDARSSTKYRKRDFKKSNLINGSRKLIKEGVIGFKTARGKEMEVLMVLLTDVVLFLEDNGQKYMFLSQDKKSGAVPLFKLLARENGSRRDKRSMYLITQLIDSYDMYEIVCKSKFECDDWIATFRNAIMKCPEEEDEGVPDEGDDELRKIAEAKFAKLKELVGLLSRKDDAIQQSCDERFKVIQDMCVTHGYDGILKGLKSIYKDSENMGAVLDPRDLLQAVVQEASRLGCLIQSNPANVSLSRSASSVGEHDSGLHIGDELPRRAETFAGFDNVPNGAVKRAGSTKKRNLPEIPSGEGQDGRSASLQNLRQQESDTDSLQSPDSVDKVRQFWPRERRSSGGSTNSGHEGVTRTSSTGRDHNRVSRRPSIIHTLTNLVGKEDSESRATSDRSSDRGSGYFMELSTGSSSLQSLVAPSREQMESLTQLTKYLHELVTFANRQSTQVDSLRIQLAEAIDQAERLKASQKSNLERKSTFRANQQLEELRKLQEDVAIERKKWDKEKSREKQRLEAESAEMDLKHQEIAKELEELKNQKAELQRQKQAVQLQIDFFQLQKQQTLTSSDKDLHSTTKDGVDGSHVSVKGLHKRSASDDWSKFNDGDPFEPMDVQYSKSLKEPLNRDKADLGQNRPYSTGSAGNLLEIGSTSPSYGGQQKRRESGANVSLPEHLCSATNEVKSSNIQQKIPVKLSSLASSSSLKSFSVSKKDKDKDRGSGSHSNSFAFNLNNNSSPNLQESPHRSSRVSVGTKPNKSPSNILPLKLAESAGRKRSDSPSMHEHAPGSSSPMNQRRETSPPNEQDAKQRQHQQMPEQKVIYF